MRQWYQTGELARTLKVTRQAVGKWIREGKLQAFRPSPTGPHYRITAEEAERFIEWRLHQEARRQG